MQQPRLASDHDGLHAVTMQRLKRDLQRRPQLGHASAPPVDHRIDHARIDPGPFGIERGKPISANAFEW